MDLGDACFLDVDSAVCTISSFIVGVERSWCQIATPPKQPSSRRCRTISIGDPTYIHLSFFIFPLTSCDRLPRPSVRGETLNVRQIATTNLVYGGLLFQQPAAIAAYLFFLPLPNLPLRCANDFRRFVDSSIKNTRRPLTFCAHSISSFSKTCAWESKLKIPGNRLDFRILPNFTRESWDAGDSAHKTGLQPFPTLYY